MTNTGVEYILSLKDLFTSKIRSATKETEKLNGAVNTVKMALSAIGGAYVINDIVKTTAAFEGLRNQLNFAAGDAIKGGEDLEWLRSRAEYLGLDLQSAAEGFSKFSAAARNTSLEGQGVRDVFEGVAEATTAMHLSADDANGVFRALQQMLSKGKVSAEELNGQLGERLPGAFQIAARSMNMTTAELMKMMQQGQLISEEFLPRFGQQLRMEFGKASDDARESLTANMNRMNNSILELKVTLGETFLPIIQATIQAIIGIGQAINSTIGFVKEYSITFGVLSTLMLSYWTYTKLAAIWTGINMVRAIFAMTGATAAQTIAQWSLNAATAVFDALTGNVWALALAGVTAAAVGVWMYKNKQEGLNEELQKTKDLQKEIIPESLKANRSQYSMFGQDKSSDLLNPTKTTNPINPKKPKGGTETSAVQSKGVQNFNISINKLVEKLEVSTTTIKEGGAAIKDEVAKALLEAVNDFQLLATK
jgi:tape measure domain-containing protein